MSFSILDHTDALTPAKTKGRYICPVCQGNNLTIAKDGKFQCWDGCDTKAIMQAVASRPEPDRRPTPIRKAPQTAPAPGSLHPDHHDYFFDRGFTQAHLSQIEAWGVRSISKAEALTLGIKKYDPGTETHLSDGGIWFPFTYTYGQIRFNQPLTLSTGQTFKYLSPRQSAKAWIPPGGKGFESVEAITEGWADAAAPTIRGVRTAAIVGTYNVIYSVDEGCQVPLIYDSDGWQKPQVMRALLLGAIWTNGKVNLFPEMPQYPGGGGSEFFKAGYTIADYQVLISEAMRPDALLDAWIERWDTFDDTTRMQAAWVASEAVEWIRNPSQVLNYLQQQRVAKLPDDGLSANHEEAHDLFLSKVLSEVAA